MSVQGYYVRDENGHLVEKIEGTVPRSVLNKHRMRNRKVKKIIRK